MKQLRVYFLAALCLLLVWAAHAGEVITETFKSEAIGRDYKYTGYLRVSVL